MLKKSIAFMIMAVIILGVFSSCNSAKTTSTTTNSTTVGNSVEGSSTQSQNSNNSGATSTMANTSQTDSITNRSNTATSGNKTLKVAFFLGGAGDSWFKYLKTTFEKQNPGINVVLDGSPTIGDTIIPRIEGNVNLPDVMFIGGSNWKRWGVSNDVIELSDLYKQRVPGTNMTLDNYIVDSQKAIYIYKCKNKDMKYSIPWTK